MSLSLGPNLGLLVNGAPGDEHFEQLMRLLRALDFHLQPTVIDATLTAPPGSPTDGAAYIIPSGASGAWFGHTNEIARWSAVESLWEFYTPKRNYCCGVNDEGTDGVIKRYTGSAWVDLV